MEKKQCVPLLGVVAGRGWCRALCAGTRGLKAGLRAVWSPGMWLHSKFLPLTVTYGNRGERRKVLNAFKCQWLKGLGRAKDELEDVRLPYRKEVSWKETWKVFSRAICHEWQGLLSLSCVGGIGCLRSKQTCKQTSPGWGRAGQAYRAPP